MAVKVYKTINPGNLSTVVNGVRITFSGTMNEPGVYSTSDGELQKAIEADPNYGLAFALAYSEVADEPEAGAPVDDEPEAAAPKKAGRPKKTPEPVEEKPGETE
jgi:hypothetical protein